MSLHLLADKTIQSSHNPLFSQWRDCLRSKGIQKHGQFFVSGWRAVEETLLRFPELARSLFVSTDMTQNPEALHDKTEFVDLLSRARQLTERNHPRFSVIALAPALFNELDAAGTHSPLLLVKAPQLESFDLTQAPEGLEIVAALGDPANLGALIRSAAAFGASRLILLREAASPFHPKAVRAASATTFLTPLFAGPSIDDYFTLAQKHATISLHMNGTPTTDFVWPKNARLLLGEEGRGIPIAERVLASDNKLNKFISISMRSEVESLNATVAASIALYSYQSFHARLKPGV